MPLSEEHRRERQDLTREAAAALIEDLEHIRDVTARPQPSRSALRRLSAVLRRILSERDLSIVAAPRIGRIKLLVPDNKPIIKARRNTALAFFASGGGPVGGMTIRASILYKGTRLPLPDDFDPGRTVEVRIDGFLSQPVLCFKNVWVSRGDTIKYMANVASGVHSGNVKEDVHKALRGIRNSITYSKETGISYNLEAIAEVDPPFIYDPKALDPVLFELIATAHYLLDSPDTQKLKNEIIAELKRS